MDDDDIPVLTDLIEEKIDITAPETNLDVDQEIFIDDDEDLFPVMKLEPEEPALPDPIEEIEIPALPDSIEETEIPVLAYSIEETEIPVRPYSIEKTVAINPALEQTIRRILDEHMELAWQEIRLAIQEEQESDH